MYFLTLSPPEMHPPLLKKKKPSPPQKKERNVGTHNKTKKLNRKSESMGKIKERNKGLNLRREHGQQMLEGWKAHGVSMFQIAARRRQHTSWAAGMAKDSGAEAQWPVQMQQHVGGHGGGLGGVYGYVAHVCGDVGSIGGASSMMELLGQPAMALTADRPAQGSAQAQECAVQGSAPAQECAAQGPAPAQEGTVPGSALAQCAARGCGVRGWVGSPEGDCLRLRGVAGRRGEREARVVRGAGAGGLLCGHGCHWLVVR